MPVSSAQVGTGSNSSQLSLRSQAQCVISNSLMLISCLPACHNRHITVQALHIVLLIMPMDVGQLRTNLIKMVCSCRFSTAYGPATNCHSGYQRPAGGATD